MTHFQPSCERSELIQMYESHRLEDNKFISLLFVNVDFMSLKTLRSIQPLKLIYQSGLVLSFRTKT